MSRRQAPVSSVQWAVSSKTKTSRPLETGRLARLPTAPCSLPTLLLHFDITNVLRTFQRFHKIDRVVVFEQRIISLDYQKEMISCRQIEVWRVEYGMVWLRQFIKRQHSKHRCK